MVYDNLLDISDKNDIQEIELDTINSIYSIDEEVLDRGSQENDHYYYDIMSGTIQASRESVQEGINTFIIVEYIVSFSSTFDGIVGFNRFSHIGSVPDRLAINISCVSIFNMMKSILFLTKKLAFTA